jgi:hypothetical protein
VLRHHTGERPPELVAEPPGPVPVFAYLQHHDEQVHIGDVTARPRASCSPLASGCISTVIMSLASTFDAGTAAVCRASFPPS